MGVQAPPERGRLHRSASGLGDVATALGGAGYLVEHVFRGEYGRLVASVTRLLGDLAAAEETVQEALAAALVHWPVDGLPDNPGAWLMTVARNRARDHLRRRQSK